MTSVTPWRESREINRPIKLRNILRQPDNRDAERIKYKDKDIDWISEHYSTRLSERKGEYLLEKELVQTIIERFVNVGWKVIMYEYRLHRWDGDLIFVSNEVKRQCPFLIHNFITGRNASNCSCSRS